MKFQKNIPIAGADEWAIYNSGHEHPYLIEIWQLEKIKKVSPLTVNKIIFQLLITLKPVAPGTMTQIMMHVVSEHDDQLEFKPKCILFRPQSSFT